MKGISDMAKRPTITAMDAAAFQLRKKSERLADTAMKHYARLMKQAATAKTERERERYERRALRDLELFKTLMARTKKVMEQLKKK